MPIVVAHPDTQHSVHAARGLKRAGLLEYLFTSFSLKRPGWLGSALRALAPEAHVRLAQHRAHADFEAERLRVYPLHLLATRLGDRLERTTRRAFARAAGRMALRRRSGVLAFDTNGAETFRVMEGSGLPRILDQSIAHRRWRERVESEELAVHPAWARPGGAGRTSCAAIEDEEEEVARADLVLCGSEFCASTMVAEGVRREKLAVVEYGTDTARFSPAERPDRPSGELRLLFVGALVLRKGVPYLLEAARRVQGLKIKVTLAGAVNVAPEALAPYADFTEVRGTLLHEDMPDLYRSHDVYVFPSLVEGSSLSVYEALASGLPVVTTPNSGSIVRDGVDGFVVPQRDVEALAGAIENLARSRELRVEMGRAARARAIEYGDWRHYGERLVNQVLAAFPETSRAC